MPDYNLSGLSSRSFEHLVQAIAIKIIGNHVRVFGDGPDGQREATFEGQTHYPGRKKTWDGYGVIQAKFRQRPLGTKEDGEWVLKVLKAELEGFAGKTRDLRIPQYYIFVTNVVFSPVHKKGTKDKAVKLIETYKNRLPLLDYAFWDFDQICRFLDSYADIRTRYAAFITSGDILAKMKELLQDLQPDFDRVIRSFLQKELLQDQYSRLEQAGHSTEKKISLSNVFIDLPSLDKPHGSPPDEKEKTESFGFVRYILSLARECFVPGIALSSAGKKDSKHSPGQIVLVGGPGQGKTTLGQYICQLFRAAILADCPPTTVIPQARDVLNDIKVNYSKDGGQLPKARRFPVRVLLTDLAESLVSKEPDTPKTLFSFILKSIAEKAELPLKQADLHKWLTEYPWILILDGLDEVPASGNREKVLASIRDFQVDVGTAGGDVIVIATTRPQGYNEDFSPKYYDHMYLVPLSKNLALRYAERLIKNRYQHNKDTQQHIMNRIRECCTEKATSRLMQSPLQVTIMTALVTRIGVPPRDRYRLFNDFYRVIYDREQEHQIPDISQVLRDYKGHVDAIHKVVGLRLQKQAEKLGEFGAALSQDELRILVTDYLQKEEFEDKKLHELTEYIIDTSLNRLVFLVGLGGEKQDRIGFEIRSFQEYMAAEAIMDGKEEEVYNRLRKITAIPFWRNVFLFAAGRCFAHQDHLRDTIQTICDQLDDENKITHTLHLGAGLALDILEDGMARSQPKYAKAFTRIALRLLELLPDDSHAKLVGIIDDNVEGEFCNSLSKYLHQKEFTLTLAAWRIVLDLIKMGKEWAVKLAESAWPVDTAQQAVLFSLVSSYRMSEWELDKLNSLFPSLTIKETLDISSRFEKNIKYYYNSLKPSIIDIIRLLFDGEPKPVSKFIIVKLIYPDNFLKGIEFILSSCSLKQTRIKRLKLIANLKSYDPHFQPFISNAKFILNPSKISLAKQLRLIADTWNKKVLWPVKVKGWPLYRATSICWPLLSCLNFVTSQNELYKLADASNAGKLGDINDWLAAENRWEKKGITIDDIHAEVNTEIPFKQNIATRSYPIYGSDTIISLDDLQNDLYFNFFNELLNVLPVSILYMRIINDITWIFSVDEFECMSLDPEFVLDIISQAWDYLPTPKDVTFLKHLSLKQTDNRLLEILDTLGKRIQQWRILEQNPDSVIELLSIANNHHELHGLLSLILPLVQQNYKLVQDLYKPDFTPIKESHLRKAAIIIRLAQQDWDADEGKQLCKAIIEMWPEADEILSILEGITITRDSVMNLLVKLTSSLPPQAWKARAKVLRLLQENYAYHTRQYLDEK